MEVSGVKVGASRPWPAPRARATRARASSLAPQIDLLDGLVTTTAARRTAIAPAARRSHRPRRRPHARGPPCRRRDEEPRLPLSDASSVAVNRGKTALTLILGSAHGSLPKGTKLRVATATALAEDAVVATPTATPTPTATATPKPEKKPPKRKRAPKVPKRLTGQGYTFPSTARRPPQTTSAPPAPTPASMRATTSSPRSAPLCSRSPTDRPPRRHAAHLRQPPVAPHRRRRRLLLRPPLRLLP